MNQPTPPKSETAESANHLARGKAFGSSGQWRQAESELRIYRNQHPDSTSAIVLHAEALIQISQSFDAALELQKFLQRHPDALRAHELYAVLAASVLRDSTLAARELEECVRLAPRDYQAWLSLGDLYMDQAKAEEAIRAYNSASRLKPNDPVSIASLAHANSEGGFPQRAEVQFKRSLALAKGPGISPKNSAIVEYLYGVYLAEQGRGAESVTALTKALSFNPASADAHYWRARAYDRINDPKRAEADALEAIRLSPSSKEAPLFLITLYRKAGDKEKTVQYAEIAQKLSDEEQKHATFGRSLRDALDKAEPLLRQGRFEEATPQYESIIKLLPTFYEAYFDLGMCYSQTGHPLQAEEAFRKYLSFQPVSADGHAALGILVLAQGRGSEAIVELQQAIQIDPSLTEARKALASEYLKEQNPKDAVAILRPVKDGRDIEVEVMLATALGMNGEHSSALAQINRALAIEPGNAEALQVRQRLLSPAVSK